jgi:hypothetical protein
MRLDKQIEKISVVDDERAGRTPERAFLDRKGPDSGGAPVPKPSTILLLAPCLNVGETRWKSQRNSAGICHKEIQ